MANIINLTPHEINLQFENGEEIVHHAFPASGQVARVSQKSVSAEEIYMDFYAIPTVENKMGKVEGLPEPSEGTFLIVSSMVQAAAPERADLLAPGEMIRNDEGKIIGVKNFKRS